MRWTIILRAVTGLLIVISLGAVLCVPGCDSQKEEFQLSQKQNEELTQRVEQLNRDLEISQNTSLKYKQRVTELENQLIQIESHLNRVTTPSQQTTGSVSTSATATDAATVGSIYKVVEGDSLWGIADEQLGDGLRYKEILALNPRIKNQNSLAVGMRLNLPSNQSR